VQETVSMPLMGEGKLETKCWNNGKKEKHVKLISPKLKALIIKDIIKKMKWQTID
jgi:hypothetical protein